MPAFLEEFMAELEKKKGDLAYSLSPNAFTPEEEKIKKGLKDHWHPLPEPKFPERKEFAVDSSRATRTFFNGTRFVVSRAILVGKESEFSNAFVDFFRVTGESEESDKYCSLASEMLEAEIILEHIEELEGCIVYADGSFFSRLQSYLLPLRIKDKNMPLRILGKYALLLEECEKRDILLINVSKFSQVDFFSSHILGSSSKIPDIEVIERFTAQSPGFSTPLHVGGGAIFRYDYRNLIQSPQSILSSFEEYEDASLLEKVRGLSTFVMVHARLTSGEPTLRVDVPAFSLGIKRKIEEMEKDEWLPCDIATDVISHLISCHGGYNVYNALLWTADRLVRLEKRTVDGVLLHVLRESGNEWIDFERGYGRFAL